MALAIQISVMEPDDMRIAIPMREATKLTVTSEANHRATVAEVGVSIGHFPSRNAEIRVATACKNRPRLCQKNGQV